MEEAAEGYQAMDQRRAIKTLLWQYGGRTCATGVLAKGRVRGGRRVAAGRGRPPQAPDAVKAVHLRARSPGSGEAGRGPAAIIQPHESRNATACIPLDPPWHGEGESVVPFGGGSYESALLAA
jgi:hypothetical protein